MERSAGSPAVPLAAPLAAALSLAIAIAVALFATVAIAAALAPAAAYAAGGDYSIDELSTEINVETNGSAHVIERQIYTFNEECEGCVWYLHVPEDGESVRISNVRVAPVDDGGTPIGDWTRLQAVDVNRVLQGSEPGDVAARSLRTPDTRPWFSYSIGDGMVRCYFPTNPDDRLGPIVGGPSAGGRAVSTRTDATKSYLIETDYVVAHRVRVFSDVGELYWRYVNSSLPVDAHNVSLHITLPVPPDAGEVVPGETVIAWGHGPDAGTFEIGADGSVTYFVDTVKSGNYAEAHILFPTSWMTNLASNAANVFTGMRQPSARAEEHEWVDSERRGENWDNSVRALFLGIAVAILLAGVVAVARNGRSPRSRRALVRVAVTIGIVALGAHLFFREPLTVLMLAVIAVAVGAVALWLPMTEEAEDEDTDVGEGEAADAGEGEAADAGEGEAADAGEGEPGDAGASADEPGAASEPEDVSVPGAADEPAVEPDENVTEWDAANVDEPEVVSESEDESESAQTPSIEEASSAEEPTSNGEGE